MTEDSIDHAALMNAVRILAIEESPLWEVPQEIALRSPDRAEADRQASAAQVVSELLRMGAVTLVRARWTATDIVWRPVRADEIKTRLECPTYGREGNRHEEHVELQIAAAA